MDTLPNHHHVSHHCHHLKLIQLCNLVVFLRCHYNCQHHPHNDHHSHHDHHHSTCNILSITLPGNFSPLVVIERRKSSWVMYPWPLYEKINVDTKKLNAKIMKLAKFENMIFRNIEEMQNDNAVKCHGWSFGSWQPVLIQLVKSRHKRNFLNDLASVLAFVFVFVSVLVFVFFFVLTFLVQLLKSRHKRFLCWHWFNLSDVAKLKILWRWWWLWWW